MAKMTPMMEQYLAIKQQAEDAILFFRLGDFYEMFNDDAIVAAKELEITLTGRGSSGTEDRIPMCGVPYHSADSYIQRLIEKGTGSPSASRWRIRRPPRGRAPRDRAHHHPGHDYGREDD